MPLLTLLRRSKPVKRTSRKLKVEDTLQESAEAALTEATRLFPLSYTPSLEWRRYSVTAGMAHYQRGLISLSSVVLKDVAQVRETLLHEYAHLLAYDRHGRKGAGHGRYWKEAMVDLGLEPKIHHHYEVVRNQSHQTVVYQCKKCGDKFQRKRRLQQRKRYFHRLCGGQIVFVEVQRATSQKETA